MFGLSERSLIGSLLTDMLKTSLSQQAAVEETLLELTGDALQLSALVVSSTHSFYLPGVLLSLFIGHRKQHQPVNLFLKEASKVT